MAPPPVHERREKGPSAHTQGGEIITDFISLVQRLCTENSYQALKAMTLDNDELRKQLYETNTAYEKNVKELGRQAEQ
jgi:hypothetical protein